MVRLDPDLLERVVQVPIWGLILVIIAVNGLAAHLRRLALQQ